MRQRAGTTAAHSSKLRWSRNSCLGRGTCPTGQESPSTQAELGAVAVLAVPAGASLCKHLNRWFFSYVGVKSSASSESKFSVYQTTVTCNSLVKSCSSPPLSFLLTHVQLGPPWPVAGAERLLSCGMFAQHISFCLAERLPLPSHTQLVCKALLHHSKTET